MTELPLNDADVKPSVRQLASTSVPERMHMHPLHDTRLPRVTLEHFPDIAVGQAPARVGCKYEGAACPADGKPIIDLPDGSVVNANNPTLPSFSFEYSDGSSITVDVANAKIKSLIAPKLAPQVDHDEGSVPRSGRGWWKRLKDLAKRLVPEDFRWEC